MLSADQNGWSDTPEDEQEALSAWGASWDIPDSLPEGTPSPWDEDGFDEDLAGPEYWAWLHRLRDEEES